MPVYEYYCEKCDKIYEYIQKISDPPKETCEVCRGPLKKQISLSSFHLKGSGWYVTDYGGKNNSNGAAKKENGEKPSAEKKEEKTAKPEKKAAKAETSSSASK